MGITYGTFQFPPPNCTDDHISRANYYAGITAGICYQSAAVAPVLSAGRLNAIGARNSPRTQATNASDTAVMHGREITEKSFQHIL